MFDNNNIRKRDKGKHLTSIERGKIEAYLKEGLTKSLIAEKKASSVASSFATVPGTFAH